jgi:hypothetical protein
MAFDFDSELQRAVAHWESQYGDRDKSFSFLAVEFHNKPYAQTLVNEQARTLAVRLDFAAKGDDLRLKFQLWHEAVHCLAPVETMETIWFEEGLAVYSSLYAPPINREYRRRCLKDMERFPDWYRPYKAFTKLKATSDQIKSLHEALPLRRFDNVTADLIVECFDINKTFADQLCQRLTTTRKTAP